MFRLAPVALAAGLVTAFVIGGVASAAPPGTRYTVTPLVSNVLGVAPVTDSSVQNAWGLARSGASPWWISDNGTNLTSVYNGAGGLVAISGFHAQSVAGAPTGAVFSGIAGQFQVGTAASPTSLAQSNFIFDAEDGTISAWRAPPSALVTVPASPGASYKGLAISNGASGPRLYAADFGTGAVDVFDGSWHNVTTPGEFVDPELPKGFAPFGIQTIGSRVFVTYGIQGPDGDEVDRPAAGIVDVYSLDGVFLHRVATRGNLNAPWGLAQAPAGWGAFGGDLLIGNFGDGSIQAFTEQPDGSFEYAGSVRDKNGTKLVIDGLWALEFGNSGNNGNAQTLYFTAGPNDEADGLFGSITPTS